ncbi:hypothetical protein P4O66_008077, partial [Electrophorus voltai]
MCAEVADFLQSITTDLQTSCGLQISRRTAGRERHGIGFHGRAAASKPYITKRNAKHQMLWCKACGHWTLEQQRRHLWSDASCFFICQSDGRLGNRPFLFQHDYAPVYKVRSIKTWMSAFGVEELDWSAQSPVLNPIKHLWDELEWRLRARPSRPTPVSDLTNVLL